MHTFNNTFFFGGGVLEAPLILFFSNYLQYLVYVQGTSAYSFCNIWNVSNLLQILNSKLFMVCWRGVAKVGTFVFCFLFFLYTMFYRLLYQCSFSVYRSHGIFALRSPLLVCMTYKKKFFSRILFLLWYIRQSF